ncbi:MAG: PaaI family thioesterase [Lachnospiraceae bacterium]|nr:PaaI family thioesterase [Lachnospiraceae bacterium]
MGTFKDVEDAREHFHRDHFATENGVEIQDFGEGWARCTMRITEHHLNALGGVMGGTIFTLADMTAGMVANNYTSPSVTQQVSLNFLNPALGDLLTARARCRRNGRTSCVVNMDVTDDQGQDLAQCVFTFYKLP